MKKKELTEKLEQNILAVLQEINPTLSKKLKRDIKAAGKALSGKWMDVQKDIEKKAAKALKKQAPAKVKKEKKKK